MIAGIQNTIELTNNREARAPNLRPIATDARRCTYLKKNFMYNAPVPIRLGSASSVVNGKLKMKKHTGFKIPFEESLKNILALPEYQKFICNKAVPKQCNMYDGIYSTPATDSIYTIYIALSCDDLEIVNPLGMGKKVHKEFVALFEVLNVPPEYRSPLQTKFLLFMCNSSYVRNYGTKLLLADFIETINRSAGGIKLDDSRRRFVHGSLLIC